MMLKAATAATGAALVGSYGSAAEARPAMAMTASRSGAARVGATVTQLAYKPGTTLDQAMADFNA
jgi:hypothetical protein